MRTGSAIVHLIGYPGAGKYTVARRLAHAAERDGHRYVVAANFGLKETTVTLRPPAAAPLADLRLAPLDTAVLALER